MRKNPEGQVELVLESRRLLWIFFIVVGLFGVFFSLGYIVGRNTPASWATKAAQAAPGAAESPSKPSAMPPAAFANEPPATTAAAEPGGDQQAAGSDLNFYRSVEEKAADAKLTTPEAAAASTATESTPQHAAEKPSVGPVVPAQPVAAVAAQPPAPPTVPQFSVQVSALTRREDASSLLSLIKGKNLPVQVVETASDKLFHVMVGPFQSLKDAEHAKAVLEEDGFRPIIKK